MRSVVEGGYSSPFCEYMMQLMDISSFGSALMHFVQTAILFFFTAFLVAQTRTPLLLQLTVIVMLAIAPPLLGAMTVVWNGAAVGACFIFGAIFFLRLISLKPGSGREAQPS